MLLPLTDEMDDDTHVPAVNSHRNYIHSTSDKPFSSPSTFIKINERDSASSYMSSGPVLSPKQKGSRRARKLTSHSHSELIFKSCSLFPEYISRAFNYRQMDFDAAFYQMITVCIRPSKVYKSAYYRKQTKNLWARDDPAFAVLQSIFLLVAITAWAIAFRVSNIWHFFSFYLYAILVEWLGMGLFISTLCYYLTNRYLRLRADQSIGDTLFVEQRVEWQYAFDIHCNSYFVLFLILYVLQYLLAPLLGSEAFVSFAVGNLMYCIAWGLYVYITFLGYMALPFLHRTERLLSPLLFIGAFYFFFMLMRFAIGIQSIAQLALRYHFG